MKRKFLALLLALTMLLSMGVSASGEGDLAGTVVVIHTNDVHGAVDGYAKVAAMKDIYEEQGAYVLLLDAGGYLQGHRNVSASRGEGAITLMNAAGYDLAAIGSYEFDYGYERLKELSGKATFPMLSANTRYQGKAVFEANRVFTAADGIKIGVFGLTTPETTEQIVGEKLEGITFLEGDALVQCAREQVALLEEKGCELILCLSHLGIQSEGLTSIELLHDVGGIDVLIDGHDHATLEEIKEATGGSGKVGDTVITSAGSGFEEIGVMLLKDGEAITMNLSAESIIVSDEGVAAKAEKLKAEAAAEEPVPMPEPEENPETEPGPEPEEQPDITYSDVSAGDWYAGAVAFVTEQGLMNGSGGAFDPKGTLNRAMMVTVLYRMAGSPAVESTPAFLDVAENNWYADGVVWAVEQGITNGISASAFDPNGAITREQLATFLYRYAGSPAVKADLSGYRDAGSVGSYAKEAMGWANANGLVTGTTTDTLSPKNTADRATVATVLMRYLQNSK